jgi:hypothetical protein
MKKKATIDLKRNNPVQTENIQKPKNNREDYEKLPTFQRK